MQLAVRGGTLVFDGIEFPADLYVNDGRIAAIGTGLAIEAEKQIDAQGCHVLPGLIDLDSLTDASTAGALQAETVSRASQMAILGGFTTQCYDVVAGSDVAAARTLLGASCFTDFALRSMVTRRDGSRRAAVESARKGEAAAVRVSMRKLGAAVEALPPDELLGLLRELGGQRPLFVFPQDGVLGDLAMSTVDKGTDSWAQRAAMHPAMLSRAALRSLTTLLEAASGNVVAMPISSAGEVDVLLEAREQLGTGLMAVTELAYMVFHGEEAGPGTKGRTQAGYPPPRRKTDLVPMWKALDAGIIDAIAVGASLPGDDLLGNPMFALPALYAAGVATRRVTLPVLVSALADNPAKMLSLYPGKGTLQVGSLADLVVFDTTGQTMAPEGTPFASVPMEGCIRAVVRRGQVLAEEGQLVSPSTAGSECTPAAVELKK